MKRLICILTHHRWTVEQIWPPLFRCTRCGTEGHIP